MLYIFVLASIAIFTGLYFLSKKFWSDKRHLIEKICSLVFAGIFLIRFFSVRNIQTLSEYFDTFALLGGYQNKFLNLVGNLLGWVEITAAIFLMLRPFFRFKTSVWYVKYFSSVVFALCLIGIYPMLSMIQGSYDLTFTGAMLGIEIGTGFALCLYYFLTGLKRHISKHSYPEVALTATFINFATMQCFIPYFFFGLGNINNHVYDMSIFHRVFIYIFLIALPLTLYFSLRNANPVKIRYFLLIIAIGTTLAYFGTGDWRDLVQPWELPFHLCNLAMVLICIVLIFKPKRLFYFTYFINVFGAILAMLMPNYDEFLLVFDPTVVHFWANHMIAFWMPLLCVALKLYERPKLKQYFYSSVGFLGYFILVFVLNTVFTAYQGTVVHYLWNDFTIRGTDFFFINSTFIAEKLGDWAESLFNITVTWTLNGKPFTIHPIYQFIYFTVYTLIGFGVWFVYQLFFDIADSHYDLHLRLRGIRLDKIALQSSLDGRSLDEPMEKDVGTQLKLEHFSKKYGTNNYYSVEDANLEVKGGEVFGFLGPNGAGKSTIIKSIVGIQPITEGNIFVCGYNVKSQAVHAKSQIGFVPDHYALYEKLTGREYLNYIADIYDVSQEDRDARLNEYIKLFELEASIDNKIKTYSHGMKQKITIMSALVHEPKVWILDEPLTGLDPTSIFQVKEQMKKHAKKGNIVFFSSHLIDIVEKLCDRIAIIKKGHIQCVVTVEEIEKTGMSLEDYYLSIINK
ncbi:MAG: YwaF family protein [Bacilli bacterium]|nr:YwaF family protein [Bacilli bacterium]